MQGAKYTVFLHLFTVYVWLRVINEVKGQGQGRSRLTHCCHIGTAIKHPLLPVVCIFFTSGHS